MAGFAAGGGRTICDSPHCRSARLQLVTNPAREDNPLGLELRSAIVTTCLGLQATHPNEQRNDTGLPITLLGESGVGRDCLPRSEVARASAAANKGIDHRRQEVVCIGRVGITLVRGRGRVRVLDRVGVGSDIAAVRWRDHRLRQKVVADQLRACHAYRVCISRNVGRTQQSMCRGTR